MQGSKINFKIIINHAFYKSYFVEPQTFFLRHQDSVLWDH